MILYLTSEEHQDLLDRLEILFYKKMVGLYDIEEFLRVDLLRLEQVTTLIIDMHCVQNSESDFLQAAAGFLEYSNAKLILYAESINKDLLEKLLSLEIYNIVIAKSYSVFEGKMDKAIKTGYTKEEAYKEHLNVVEKHKNGKYSFIGKKIEIAIYGLYEGAGATTIVTNLASFLAREGAKVVVAGILADDLAEIAAYYSLKLVDNKIDFSENLTIYSSDFALTDTILNQCNFLIADMGIIQKNPYKANITLLVNKSKEKDIRRLEQLADKSSFHYYLLGSAEESKRETIRKRLKGLDIFYVENMPSYFGEDNELIFQAICSDYML